jgi:hypothetical protein
MSVPVSVHQPSSDRTLAVLLDSAPDLSCTDSTQDYCLDVDHSLRIWRLAASQDAAMSSSTTRARWSLTGAAATLAPRGWTAPAGSLRRYGPAAGSGRNWPGREVDRGRHDLCGYAAISRFQRGRLTFRASPGHRAIPVRASGVAWLIVERSGRWPVGGCQSRHPSRVSMDTSGSLWGVGWEHLVRPARLAWYRALAAYPDGRLPIQTSECWLRLLGGWHRQRVPGRTGQLCWWRADSPSVLDDGEPRRSAEPALGRVRGETPS